MKILENRWVQIWLRLSLLLMGIYALILGMFFNWHPPIASQIPWKVVDNLIVCRNLPPFLQLSRWFDVLICLLLVLEVITLGKILKKVANDNTSFCFILLVALGSPMLLSVTLTSNFIFGLVVGVSTNLALLVLIGCSLLCWHILGIFSDWFEKGFKIITKYQVAQRLKRFLTAEDCSEPKVK
jgi:hypothetical protein